MLKFKLRGYLTPEDFLGSDTERIQKALDTSHSQDIGRVVLSGSYEVDKTLFVHPMTDLVFERATLSATGAFPLLANKNLDEKKKHFYCFRDEFITLRGKGRIEGEVVLYNAFRVKINGIEFGGGLKLLFTEEVRLYNSNFSGKCGILMGMGANNFIMQNLSSNCDGPAIVMDASHIPYDYVVGKEPDIHDIILQDSSFGASSPAVLLNSTVDARIYNIQIDHISSDGTVLSLGKKDNKVPPECYFNLTAENLTSKQGDKIILNAPTKNCFFNV